MVFRCPPIIRAFALFFDESPPSDNAVVGGAFFNSPLPASMNRLLILTLVPAVFHRARATCFTVTPPSSLVFTRRPAIARARAPGMLAGCKVFSHCPSSGPCCGGWSACSGQALRRMLTACYRLVTVSGSSRSAARM